MNLVVGGVIVGELYERKPMRKLPAPDKQPCVDCGVSSKRGARLRKRCLPCFKEFHKTLKGKAQSNRHSFSSLMSQVETMPADMRDVISTWLSRRKFVSDFERCRFLNDAIAVVTRAVDCQFPCCADMTREQRLAECRDELCR